MKFLLVWIFRKKHFLSVRHDACLYMSTDFHVPWCICGGQRINIGVSPILPFFLRWGLLLFTAVSASRSYRCALPHQTLHGCWAVSASRHAGITNVHFHIGWTLCGCWAVFAHRSAGLTDVHFHIGLYVNARHLNSDLHPCTIRAWLTEPSPYSL